ncbi:hypothetical protein EHS25_008874 [Saitozyma podzolica]|uniref:Glycoside hydrolase family 5 domain-containing protein n=1 Tax=Saitozyma podzolica TaxID=1890683 RepID=A0A427YMU5_9TREE|nr:hypothetical protein EHS25_008874 [Saitozyma podzolica]
MPVAAPLSSTLPQAVVASLKAIPSPLSVAATPRYHFDNPEDPTIKSPAPLTVDSSRFLHVQGKHICLEGKPKVLRGACLGGWMMMENFMTGFPGHEHQLRAGMLKALGKEKYEFFFDKFLEYYFTEADAQAFKNAGFNFIRLGVNYRHFEDDSNPRVFKYEGLKHLDRCARYGIYSVIDLHALPGGQNTDFHCDNPTDKALFWVHKDFQDRAVNIWEHLAEHYKNNPWVAGYNALNEPVEESGEILVSVMKRIENAIRAIDPNHILFWDGNGFASDFRQFKEPLPNSVYSCHDYSSMGLPNNPQYTGTDEDKAKLVQSIEWKTEFQRAHNAPIWNGEFGPTYVDTDTKGHEEINAQRYELLQEQLRLYDTYPNISWTVWCWKDIGICGVVHPSPDSKYMKLIKPFLEHKKRACVDSWGVDASHLDHLFKPMWEWLCGEAPSMRYKYPKVFAGDRGKHLFRPVRMCLLAEELVPEFCALFADKSHQELDAIAKSFHLDNCTPRTKLLSALTLHAKAGPTSSV